MNLYEIKLRQKDKEDKVVKAANKEDARKEAKKRFGLSDADIVEVRFFKTE